MLLTPRMPNITIPKKNDGRLKKKEDPKEKFLIIEDIGKDYEKITKIGSGSFGTVFKIKNKNTGQIFAAKVNHKPEISIKNSEREIDILIKTQHPTIIELIGYSEKDFENNNNLTIIMKYMAKGSLSKLIDQESSHPIGYNNTKRQIILVGIARGMMILHKKNVIHRDIKPDNILIDDDYSPRISDFGLSKFFDPDNSMYQSTNNIGTLLYAAPEVLKGENYGPKADVYSFGILMYEILTSTKAYKDSIPKAIFKFIIDIINGIRPKFTGPIKEGLKNLIERCWSDNVNERPTFSEIFQMLSLYHNGKFVPDEKGKISDLDYREAMQYCLDDVNYDELRSYIEKIADDIKVKPPTISKTGTTSPRQYFVQKNAENQDAYNKFYNNVYSKKNCDQITSLSSLISESSKVNQFYLKMSKFLEIIKNDDGYILFNYDGKGDTGELIKEPEIYIKSKLTDKLLKEHYFINNDFIDILKSLNKVYFEIDLKYSFFDQTIEKVGYLKRQHNCKIAISVIFESTSKINHILKACDLIEIINLNGSNSKIDFMSTFEDCISLRYLVLNDKCTEICIGDNTFRNCRSLQEFCTEKKVESIGNNAFQNCFTLKKVFCPGSISFLGKNCFQGCFNIRSISFKYVKNIESSAFEGCTSLKDVKIESIGNLGSNAFKGCYSIKEITMENIDIINSNAFENCTSLNSVNINYIRIIDSYAFKQCTSLTKIKCKKVDKIMPNSFEGCKSLSEIDIDAIGFVGSNAFKHFLELKNINCKTVNNIMSHAFEECFSLGKIKAENIDFIDSFAFKNCTSLKQINVNTIKTIMPNSFEGCSSVKEIKININKFLSNSFKNCSSLELFSINNYALESIEESVFEGCSSLKTLNINMESTPSLPLKHIKKSAFKGCSLINQINGNFEVETIEESAFESCSNLENFDISKAKEIKSRCFALCSSLKQILIPESVTYIPKAAFSGCSKLKVLTIPELVTIIDDEAFTKCTSLEEVIIPSTVLEKIGSNAFSYCTSLPSILIPRSVKYIGIDALKDCSNMDEITISSSVKIQKAGLGNNVTVHRITYKANF